MVAELTWRWSKRTAAAAAAAEAERCACGRPADVLCIQVARNSVRRGAAAAAL